MKIIDLVQRTPEWHAWRSMGVTATSAAVILGHHPHKTRWRLWAELTGKVEPLDLSMIPQVRLAIMLEPHALAWFQDRYDTVLMPYCGESEINPLLRASFDGVELDTMRPVEVKVLADSNFNEVAQMGVGSSHYKLYWWQVQHQLAVSGADLGYLVFYHTRNQPIVFEIRRSEKAIALILQASLAFWASVAGNNEPEKDPARDYFAPTGAVLAEWGVHAAYAGLIDTELQDLEARIKVLKAEREKLQEGFVGLMGDYLLAEAHGVRVCRYSQKGNVRWKEAYKSLNPGYSDDQLNAFRGAGGERVKLTINAQTPITTAPLELLLQAVDFEETGQAFCI
ncbi:lambda-exonuclease family protein [Pseudomonas sp. LS-2]|uniref:lambda-exonuclease family protein n=1 Tax=Pseudomonas sp. LS-2 TaxID=2315859 RepID=UPI000E7313D0|nr:YqaJ viral recombinase family protein [Pseudomonas sp. LS-2]RJX72640.1 DNA recombination protein [Pseudomonas sp. LS-2]